MALCAYIELGVVELLWAFMKLSYLLAWVRALVPNLAVQVGFQVLE